MSGWVLFDGYHYLKSIDDFGGEYTVTEKINNAFHFDSKEEAESKLNSRKFLADFKPKYHSIKSLNKSTK